MPILYVALAPAQVSANEFDQRGWVLFEARAFFWQHAHFVAGPAHQHRLDLVVTQYITADQRALRQRRQLAMRDERRQSDDGIVAPVGAAVALPPRAADRVGAHAEPHAELENARERAARRYPGDEALQNAELRISLHDAHEANNALRSHQAVGVEDDRKIVLRAPALAEIADVAGLEAGISLASAVTDCNARLKAAGQYSDLCLLR